jgi:GH24 family phage-related lysozyme (muramidase)
LSAFGADDSVGSDIYCDVAGQLRGVPEHTSSTGEASAATGSTPVADGVTTYGAAATLVLNNPSTVRACSVIVAWSIALGVTLANAAAQWTNLFVATRNALAYFTDNGSQNPQNGAAASFVYNIGDNTVDSIAAGGTVTYELNVGVTMAGGTSGSFTASAAIRALCVTQ